MEVRAKRWKTCGTVPCIPVSGRYHAQVTKQKKKTKKKKRKKEKREKTENKKKKEQKKKKEKKKEKENNAFLMTAAQTCLILTDLSIKIKPLLFKAKINTGLMHTLL